MTTGRINFSKIKKKTYDFTSPSFFTTAVLLASALSNTCTSLLLLE